MITISLCMIVKNEKSVLARLLDSVQGLVEEIVIADTGSEDGTLEIASAYTTHIHFFPWVDDFSAARNFVFGKATMDYILWLDADDIILPKDYTLLQKLKEDLDPSVDSVMLKYNTGVDEKGVPSLSYYRERLVRRERGFLWREPVHEYIETSGKSIRYPAAVTHGAKVRDESHGDRNLRIYQSREEQGEAFSPRALYYYGRELNTHGLYERAVDKFNQFLAGGKGWVEDNIGACLQLATAYESMGNYPAMRKVLLRSFEFDLPRADTCCRLGDYHRILNQYREAAFWYELALTVPHPDGLGFIYPDFYDFIPHIWLAVCYDKLGDLEKAAGHHEASAKVHPDHPSVLKNREYFEAQVKNTEETRYYY